MPSTINKYQLDKLGNTLIFLSKNVGDFNKTKALKLLFLLEEKSIKDFGIPFFGFDFKVWKYGPVVEEVYDDLENDNIPLLSKYIKRVQANKTEFEPAADFNDDEFSNNDISLLTEIINFARHQTAQNLVAYTHREGSLWKEKVIENNLLNQFNNNQLIKTPILIDFSILVKDDEFLKERYEASLDYTLFNNTLKA